MPPAPRALRRAPVSILAEVSFRAADLGQHLPAETTLAAWSRVVVLDPATVIEPGTDSELMSRISLIVARAIARGLLHGAGHVSFTVLKVGRSRLGVVPANVARIVDVRRGDAGEVVLTVSIPVAGSGC